MLSKSVVDLIQKIPSLRRRKVIDDDDDSDDDVDSDNHDHYG